MANEKILATVGGKGITEQDVNNMIMQMRQRGQDLDNPQGRSMVLEQLIAQELLLIDANANMLEREPAFKERLRKVKEEMLIGYAMQKVMEGVKVKEEDVQKYFEENKDKFPANTSFNASHILVDSEEKANEILASIKAGEIEFADAAAKYSSCPSGQNGGELGDFSSGQMVPEFEKACTVMEVGTISEPVQTQFGYHLIKLNNRTEAGEVKYEDVKNQLTEALKAEKQQAAYQSKINQLKIVYPVEKLQ